MLIKSTYKSLFKDLIKKIKKNTIIFTMLYHSIVDFYLPSLLEDLPSCL